MNLRWTPTFKRALKKKLQETPQKKEKLSSTLLHLQQDPFLPQLRTHKLKGELKDCWSSYVEYDIRVVFTFVTNLETNNKEILLLDIGSHDEVY